MQDWTAGYVTEIGYTYGYYPELNPLRMKLAFLNAGLEAPNIQTACELGFGQGLSTNFHAAAGSARWFATDFNPAHAAYARSAAQASGAPVRFHDDAFQEFSHRTDLPDFDYIGLHGVWSWISPANRAHITDFVRRKLKVGGVLYISYNTLPGWSSFLSMRHLLTQYETQVGNRGNSISGRIDEALQFASRLMSTEPVSVRAFPHLPERLERLKRQNRNYLAHEYFNMDWEPVHFSEMARELQTAKLSYACSAGLHDHIDQINLSNAQVELLRGISDPVFAQTVRDLIVNQQFRRDFWVRGHRRLGVIEQRQRLREMSFVLASSVAEVPLKIDTVMGQADLNPDVYKPLLDRLSAHQPVSLAQLEACVPQTGAALEQALQALIILCGMGHVFPAQEEATIAQVATHTARLNAWLCNAAASQDDAAFLVSPVTGGGHTVNRLHQLFLLSIAQGLTDPRSLARGVWEIMQQRGQKIVREGTTLDSDDENLAELHKEAGNFLENRLALFKSLRMDF